MKRYITSIVLAFALCAAASAAITGAVTCTAGELAIINSDSEAVWSVYPADYMASYAVSDDGKTVYFASPKKGAVTFFAATVQEGKPAIEQYTLYNGVEIPDDVTPEPAPQPAPEPEPETVVTLVKNADVDATAEEFDALASAFETAVSGIDRGTIRTPAGARETFRANWIRQAAVVNPDALTTFAPMLTKLSDKVDNSTLATVRADYAAIIDALKERAAKVKEPAKEQAGQPIKPTSTCPNGQCPANGNGYYWRFR